MGYAPPIHNYVLAFFIPVKCDPCLISHGYSMTFPIVLLFITYVFGQCYNFPFV